MHAWEQIQLTIEFIEEHLGEEISIRELADLACLSPFYYQRLFGRLVKKPVAEYIRLRRMAKAMDALLQKDRRILDIAVELGFSSHEHFTRTFKSTFGMTPEEYRSNPGPLNRMTKPELMLKYTLVDEGVPLITDGIVLEIHRRQVKEPIVYTGLEKKMPVRFMCGLGTESGVDPLDTLWRDFHDGKAAAGGVFGEEELGVAYPCDEKDFFLYFAGARASTDVTSCGYKKWELPKGEYIVCDFEAEDFEALVMDVLYKAEQYLYNVWLPRHNLVTEPFCAERYASHSPETKKMEVWLKVAEPN
ncbi:AraC family transcriptional regulator [Clostridium transplantifaecale]|uniref:AraC family transcriptional regulator n=1 Tax=Clostridium transplantifaecale TaxID=2479838 RepID=UPI000F62C394|nr:helix-turn-helix domain-containing protein [Clostridium transplantifaecale]